jgi:hypothetical protein
MAKKNRKLRLMTAARAARLRRPRSALRDIGRSLHETVNKPEIDPAQQFQGTVAEY